VADLSLSATALPLVLPGQLKTSIAKQVAKLIANDVTDNKA
jgi:hypothetical protein